MTTIAILVDNTNFERLAFNIIKEIQAADFIGLDTETHDDNRHEGLMSYCGYNPVTRKKAANTKTSFDIRRTVMTGFSLHPEGSPNSYYVNLNHADVDRRLSWEKAKLLLDAKRPEAIWIAHNANYELTVFGSCYGFKVKPYICTMQMAVSAFGPDEYDVSQFIAAGQGDIKRLMGPIMHEAMKYDPDRREELPPALMELVGKIIAKESDSAHSYNGFVKSIAHTYGLKKLVKSFFGVEMATFADTLGEKAHMGQLTGEETVSYGADDAYWAMRLFRHLLNYMAVNTPGSIDTFFNQENPMVEVYSDIWLNGMKVNTTAIFDRRDSERVNMGVVLSELKEVVKSMLPFDPEPYEPLLAESWYAKNHAKYRGQIEAWANSRDTFDRKDENPDADAVFRQCHQVRGPVSNAWATAKNLPESTGPNFSHYMPMRVLLYDLCRTKLIRSEGKVQSDGEARGKLKDRFDREDHPAGQKLIECLNKIAGVEQRMKLYLTPYTQLMDPETGRLYPTVSSMLASRRMAASTPNPMQLAKRGESTYVRGFFEPDYEDHVIVSIDWSSIELVEIGEFSGDPEFGRAYGQIPHEDLHAGAAASILGVDVPGLTEQAFKDLRSFQSVDDYRDAFGGQMANFNRLFTDLKGQDLAIDKAYKYWRTEVGKGANFNYWYSGFLGTIGDRMGWDIRKTGEATERYRSRFSVAEQWRVDLIQEGQQNGYITLPDGHRRVRFEATPLWNQYFCDKFMLPNARGDELARRFNAVIQFMARKIQTRANNQLVNSYIQGSCATIAKRSVLRINEKMKNVGWGPREARFMIPIHDELVFSVHRNIVPEFIGLARGTMIDHPDIFKTCKLDASPSVGLTFEPWHEKKAPTGQVEIFEAPPLDFVPKDKINGRLNDDETRGVVEYLFEQRKLAA